MNIQTCKSFSESVALYLPQDLFLKPLARLFVSVQLPPSKATGKTISNWELMERMREIIQPETFTSLKVVKSSSESIRFEGEIEDKRKLSAVIATLDDRSVKLNGYPEFLKLKASESKLDFPTRHTWDSFFRDASNMDEMKHGERPDTVHIANLPIKWFVSPRDVADDDAKPSENIFRKVFERFGKIRCVDIPICDPYRKQMKAHMTGISTFSFDSELYFEGYVQFSEYMGFVRAMDAFRGMKLVRKLSDGTGQAVSVRVDFDQTKHLSDASVKRRSIVRERLVGRERAKEEKEKEELLKRLNKDEAERRKAAQNERDKLSHTQEREERRKAKQLAKLKEKESKEINSKIAEEQKKLIKTQRKLQSIRLIEELFRRIQLKHKPAAGHKREDSHRDLYNVQNRRDKDNKKELKKIEKALLLENKEKSVRERLVKKYKSAQEQELEEQRQKLKKAIEGNIVLRSVLDTGKKRLRTPSISSLSSGSDICLDDFPDKKIKTERMTSPERNSFIKKEGEPLLPGYSGQVPQYNYGPYTPYMNPNYNYPNQMGNYFPRGGYYPPTAHQEQGGPPPYNPRGRGGFVSRRARGGVYNANHNHNPHRGGYRGGPRMPFFDGPNANHAYYKYFKKLAEGQTGDYLERDRSYSRSRSRSRRRSYSRSRSRSSSRSRSRSRRRSSSRRRSRYSRSRSRHSRSRSRNRRTRTRSRSRSRSRRSRSRSRDRSKSRRRRSPSKRTQSREKSPNAKKSTDFIPRAVRENADRPKADERDCHPSDEGNPKEPETEASDTRQTLADDKRATSKSWSPSGQGVGEREAWSESPSPKK